MKRIVTVEKKCSFSGCRNKARTNGLCGGHYMQQLRGQKLRPLRLPHGELQEGRRQLPGLHVSEQCAAELERIGPSLYSAAVAILEDWAERRRRRGAAKGA